MGTDRSSQVVILTGERGVGKSTVCRRATALANAQGLACDGIITLRKSSDILDALAVRSGRIRRLTLDPGGSRGLILGPYRLDPAVFAWGNDVLRRAPPCDLFVVDELGPLEFERGRGWIAAFDTLRESAYSLALAVVRPSLVERARAMPALQAAAVLLVTPENRDSLPEMIVAMVGQR